MKYKVERIFNNLNLGWSYQDFDDTLKNLIYEMRDRIRIGNPSVREEYRNLIFVMNSPFYNEFYKACQMAGKDSDIYGGIRITSDRSLYMGDSQLLIGVVRLIYDEDYYYHYCIHDVEATHELFLSLDHGHGFKRLPHIDHVKFNGPATIVFWKDGTKTVVKYDGKGRKDRRLSILYAFIRKIYGEGKPYHNILNEIEEALK